MILAREQAGPVIYQFPRRTGGVVQRTLRDYYENQLLPELTDLSENSLIEDRCALNWWERATDNPCISTGTKTELDKAVADLRTRMVVCGRSAATINKTWRELRSIFNAARDDGECPYVPVFQKRRKGKLIRNSLVQEPPKRQREILTPEEVAAICAACAEATYPDRANCVRMWRVFLFLLWSYGLRTQDLLKNLKWSDVLWKQRLLRFTAQKTTKLQGLPLTDVGVELLRSIQVLDSGRVFPGFNSAGQLTKSGKVRSGYYHTWKHEILPAANLDGVTFKHFRERVVTHYNAKHSGLGHWIAGHSVGALSMAYDKPTDQIRELIESADVPACFLELV